MALEDFTTYTEVDPNSHIALVGTDHIDLDGIKSNEIAYLYKDKGAGHFTDFEHLIDLYTVSAQSNSRVEIWALANDIADWRAIYNADGDLLSVTHAGLDALPKKLTLIEVDGGDLYYDRYQTCTADTWYYLTIERDGTTFTCKIYSDDSRETLLDTLSLALQTPVTNFRYIYPVQTDNIAEDVALTCDIEDLDLQEANEVLAAVVVGMLTSATRTLEIDRDSAVITGLVATATKLKEAPRSAAVIVGMVASATRDIVIERTAAVITEVVAVATRVAHFFESAAVAVGVLVGLDIDIGEAATDRATSLGSGYTLINRGNPANANGIIDIVKIYPKQDYSLSGCKVGIFYTTNGNTLKCRSSASIGNVTGGSEQTFTGLSLTVVAGDYIGIYFSGGILEWDSSGGDGVWIATGDYCDVDDETEYGFEKYEQQETDDTISLNGIGGIAFVSRLVEVSRTPATQIGLVASATRALIIERISSVVVGIVATAIKVGENIILAAVQIGVVASATRVLEISRNDILAKVGLVATAVGFRGATILSAVTVGVVATASKTLDITRTASVIVGKVATAVGFKGAAITAAVIIGVKATATRTLDITRVATTIVGKVVTATISEVFLIGRSLLIRVTTSPYRSIVVATSQYRLVRVATALYRKIKVFTLGR